MYTIPIGIYDDLDEQTQPVLTLNMMNNIIVFGEHASGKTTFIKNFLIRLSTNQNDDYQSEVYILDFGGNLADYGELGLVAACFNNSNEENIRRVFKTVSSKLENNTKLLRSNNFFDVIYDTLISSDKKPKQIILIIDNVNSFLADERYMNYHDELLRMCRDGLSKGLMIIFSASDITGGLSRYLGSFSNKFVYSTSSDKYIELFGQKITEPIKCPGRGVTIVDGKPREFQSFLPFKDEKTELAQIINNDTSSSVEKLQAFDSELLYNNLTTFISKSISEEELVQLNDPDRITVGLDYYDHLPVSIVLKDNHSIAIYGKKGFGKTNLLKCILNKLEENKHDTRYVFFDDGRKQLLDIYEHMQTQDKHYLTRIEDLMAFLDDNGYAAKLDHGLLNKSFVEHDTPDTIFILQNKMLFQSSGALLLKSIIPKMIAKSEEKGYWFIFSDVRKVSNNDRDTESSLNNSISIAFLLDSIAEYVMDRGSRSVFGEMDPKELKMEYAKCEIGDGYYYDIESDILKKLKFIKM